eukprot:Seg901.2 transcript_id=Seg901.2/GoldUCD/mRNA.D3Y31 product="hypothetical protein" protein_id=Seg901.2/GoldUCD/D3Y31
MQWNYWEDLSDMFSASAILSLSLCIVIVFGKGDVFTIERTFIKQAKDDVTMRAYYKNNEREILPSNVSWYRDGEIDTFGGKFELQINNTALRIRDLEMDDAGEYKCVIKVSNSSTYITEFKLIVHRAPLPSWALALIITGLVLLLIGTVVFFKCRREISDMVEKNIPRRKKRTHTCETSFHE